MFAFSVLLTFLQQGLNRCRESSAAGTQFTDPFFHDTGQRSFATRKEHNPYLAAVFFFAETSYEASLFQAINKFYGAMVLDRESVSQSAHRGQFVFLETTNRQEHLILLGLKAFRQGSRISRAQEKPDPVAQFRQCPVLRRGNLFRHGIILS